MLHLCGPFVPTGKADQLKFEWLLTPWSKCSQTCGGSGFQVRAAQCIVRLNNVTKSVEATLCEDAGLTAEDGSRQPATVQKCGMETCPKWVAGPWTPCQQSRCFTWNTGTFLTFCPSSFKWKNHVMHLAGFLRPLILSISHWNAIKSERCNGSSHFCV